MSICGNCHYNWHSEEECNHDCTFEDAVYREQEAYDSLYEEYKELKEKYDMLYNIADSFSAMPLYMKPYSSDEKRVRDSMSPMMWSPRDWQAYYEEHKEAIESLETIGSTVTKIDLANSNQAEEAGNALKKILNKLNNKKDI